MNKFLWILFVLFSVFISIECNDTDTNGTVSVGEYSYFSAYYFHAKRTFLHKKSEWLRSQFEDGATRCPGYKQKIEKANQEFDECLNRTFEHYDHQTMCYMSEIITQICTRGIAKAMKECLPEHSKKLVPFVLVSIYSITESFCLESGETLFELGNPCLWKDLEETHKSKLSHCDEKIKEIAKRYQNKSNLTTRNICSDFRSFRSCAATRVQTTCENHKTRRAFMELYESILLPCDRILRV